MWQSLSGLSLVKKKCQSCDNFMIFLHIHEDDLDGIEKYPKLMLTDQPAISSSMNVLPALFNMTIFFCSLFVSCLICKNVLKIQYISDLPPMLLNNKAKPFF